MSVHCELAAQKMLAQGDSQPGPWLGSGQTQSPALLQKALPGQSVFLAQVATPTQLPGRAGSGTWPAPHPHL